MKDIKKSIQPFMGKALLVNILDKEETLHIIDWDSIEEAHNALVVKVQDMTEEKAEAFLNNNESALMQICDYFMDDDCLDRVDDGDWIPFGLLGLTYKPSTYAEMGNGGLLLFDISEDPENPSIVFYKDGDEIVVADHFTELEITEVESIE